MRLQYLLQLGYKYRLTKYSGRWLPSSYLAYVQTDITKKRRISPRSIADQKPLTTLPPRDRSIPLNSAVRTTTKERAPSPLASLSHDFQLLATTTEAQGQHSHQPLVLHGDEPLSTEMAKRRISTDGQSAQSTTAQPGITLTKIHGL